MRGGSGVCIEMLQYMAIHFSCIMTKKCKMLCSGRPGLKRVSMALSIYSDDSLIRTRLSPIDISGLTSFLDQSRKGNRFPHFLSGLARFPDYWSPDKWIMTVLRLSIDLLYTMFFVQLYHYLYRCWKPRDTRQNRRKELYRPQSHIHMTRYINHLHKAKKNS